MVDKPDMDADHTPDTGGSFFSRWSKRKTDARVGKATFDEAPPQKPNIDEGLEAKSPEDGRESTSLAGVSEPSQPAAPVELPSVESLTKDSDFSPFMQADVPPELRNQAMKKLFADPHYNVMDMLDTYVDDYSTSEPIPLDWLKKMSQSRALKLFDEEEETAPQDAQVADVSAEPPRPSLGEVASSNDLTQVEAPIEAASAPVSVAKTTPADAGSKQH
jgi:Protein of unknown function (DUF3306)